jgi:hypothetical protein
MTRINDHVSQYDIKGQTAKRELSFSWLQRIVSDFACRLMGHSWQVSAEPSAYCDRCWRWGVETKERRECDS